jgi:isoleucyl-tRNA synthetase
VGVTGAAPYKAVVTHGFVMDSNGRKMSKSLGNVITPSHVIEGTTGQGKKKEKGPKLTKKERKALKKKEREEAEARGEVLDDANGANKKKKEAAAHAWPGYGVDVLRWWVGSTDYTSDVLVGPAVIDKVSESLRKVRNSARFLLGNLHDFDPADPAHMMLQAAADNGGAGGAVGGMHSVDLYMLHKINEYSREVQRGYADYHFSRVYKATNHFLAVELSAFYMEAAKDRLYCSQKDDPGRRACQSVLWASLLVLTHSIAPMAPYTAEDIYEYARREVIGETGVDGADGGGSNSGGSDVDFSPADSFFSACSWHRLLTDQEVDAADGGGVVSADTHQEPWCATLSEQRKLLWMQPELVHEWESVLVEGSSVTEGHKLRVEVNRLLEKARKEGSIGAASEAQVKLTFLGEEGSDAGGRSVEAVVRGLGELQLRELFMTSKVTLASAADAAAGDPNKGEWCHAADLQVVLPSFAGQSAHSSSSASSASRCSVRVEVTRADGDKCNRCWKYYTAGDFPYGGISECGFDHPNCPAEPPGGQTATE